MTLLTNSEIFQKNQYIYCPELLTLEIAEDHVQGIQKLIDEGHSTQDEQCPLSHSIGHKPTLDSLLEQLTPIISEVTGKKLHPTYAYARKYAPGDELKIHKDRPSCEISATITLGFKGEQWPIYVGNKEDKSDSKKIDMNVGDAIIYKGCDLFHWREKYTEGEGQFQIFIHYVDADGPNKEWKYDKRNELAHHSIKILSGDFTVASRAFSPESCKKIIEQMEKQKLEPAQIFNGNEGIVNKEIRDTKRSVQSNDVGIGATLTGIGLQANAHKWNFDITNSNQSEFLQYDKDGHFHSHIDTFLNEYEKKEGVRKLSVLLILNDDFEGGQFFLQTSSQKYYPKQEKGDIIIFPSFLLHGVEPVISGIRRSLITWMVGPYFK